MSYTCTMRDEDACMHARACVRLARNGMRLPWIQRARAWRIWTITHTCSLGYNVQVHGSCRRPPLEQVCRGTERACRTARQRRLPACDAAPPRMSKAALQLDTQPRALLGLDSPQRLSLLGPDSPQSLPSVFRSNRRPGQLEGFGVARRKLPICAFQTNPQAALAD